jgi:hypothetical protein
MGWAGHVAHTGAVKKAYNPEGKRPLPIPTHRCEKSTDINLNKIGQGLNGFTWPSRGHGVAL